MRSSLNLMNEAVGRTLKFSEEVTQIDDLRLAPLKSIEIWPSELNLQYQHAELPQNKIQSDESISDHDKT